VTILRVGLILVSIPLVIQIAVTIGLLSILSTLEDQLIIASRAQDVFNLCHNSVHHMMEPFALYEFSKGRGGEGLQQQDVSSFAKISTIARLVDDSPGQRERVSCLREAARDSIKILQMASADRSDRDYSREIFFSLAQCALTGLDICAGEDEILSHSSQAVTTANRQLQIWLLSLIGMSLVLALVLSWLGSRFITVPLKTLAGAAKKIALREPLPAPMTGAGEFARLDRYFREVDFAIGQGWQNERNLIDLAADMLCSLNKEGTFIRANGHALLLLGYSPDEIVGKSFIDITTPTECDRVNSLLEDAQKSTNSKQIETTLARKDGREISVVWSALWSYSEGEIFSVIHDISKQKEASRVKQEFVNMIKDDLALPLERTRELLSRVRTEAESRASVHDEATAGSLSKCMRNLLNDSRSDNPKPEVDKTTVPQTGPALERELTKILEDRSGSRDGVDPKQNAKDPSDLPVKPPSNP